MNKKTEKAWKAYDKWQQKNSNKIREGQVIEEDEFEAIYKDNGNRISNIKKVVQFTIQEKSFRKAKKFVEEKYAKQLEGIEDEEEREKIIKNQLDLHERTARRTLNTHDLAAEIKDEIYDYMKQLKQENENISKSDMRKAVASYFFGS